MSSASRIEHAIVAIVTVLLSLRCDQIMCYMELLENWRQKKNRPTPSPPPSPPQWKTRSINYDQHWVTLLDSECDPIRNQHSIMMSSNAYCHWCNYLECGMTTKKKEKEIDKHKLWICMRARATLLSLPLHGKVFFFFAFFSRNLFTLSLVQTHGQCTKYIHESAQTMKSRF